MVFRSPYLRLMRLHQPVGIWLLLWPCWWAIALASAGLPSIKILCLFGLGAVLMRASGCIINDMADRKLDAKVERTKARPLASGELSMRQATALLIALLLAALMVAIALGPVVVMWAALALVPVAIYPWMKRLSWWPQLFLGLTFNWGTLMGWAAVRGQVEFPAIILYISSIFWTLGYDTIYAHQDKIDDEKIGVKSTARRLGNKTKPMVAAFYAIALSGWVFTAYFKELNAVACVLFLAAVAQLFWQVFRLDIDDPAACKKTFISNAWLGSLVFAAFIALNP